MNTKAGPDLAPGEALVTAVVSRDRDGLAALLDEQVELRALVPRGLRVAEGPAAATDLVSGWFADATSIDVLARRVEVVGDRLHLQYRLRAVKEGEPYVVEQQAFANVVDGRIGRLDLLCSGFRPVDAPGDDPDAGRTAAGPRRFDAGALGCGDGLPAAFREQLATLAVGDRLEVLARDPAAKADLPSLARLMGHSVEATEDLPDGRVRIVVEKGR